MIDLHVIWFILTAVVIMGWAIMDGFDYGVAALLPFVAKNDTERRVVINSIGPVWDGNQVWLILGGGAVFAAFPQVYASVFSGFYLAMMLVVWMIIMRAVAFEFRSKVQSPSWRSFWDDVLTLTGIGIGLCLGLATGNVVKGVPLDQNFVYTGTFLELFNEASIVAGLMSLSLFMTHGAAYLVMKTTGEIQERAIKYGKIFSILFVVFSLVELLIAVTMDKQLLHSALGPIGFMFPILMVASSFMAYIFFTQKKEIAPFIMTTLSNVFLVATVANSLFPNIVPSTTNPQYSLNIYNASSSDLTLLVMTIAVLLGLPLVIAYAFFAYRTFGLKVKLDDVSY